MDILDQIEWKGDNFEQFKAQVLNWKIESEELESNVSHYENELETAQSELQSLQDQINYLSRNISDAIASQNSSIVATEHMNAQNVILNQSEIDQRDEIQNYKDSYEELKLQLTKGNEWPDEKSNLKLEYENGKEELSKQLNSFQDVMLNLRTIDTMNTSILSHEKDLLVLDDNINQTNIKIQLMKEKENTLILEYNMKLASEKEIKDEVSNTTKMIYEKQRTNRADETSLMDLDLRVSGIKNDMDTCLRQYDLLYKQLQQYSSEIEYTKTSNIKLNEDITERIEYIQNKYYEIESMKKEQNDMIKLNELALKKSKDVEVEKHVFEDKKANLIKDTFILRDTEISAINKQIDSIDHEIVSCKRQIQVLSKKQSSSETSTQKVENILIFNQNSKMNLEFERNKISEETIALHDKIRVVEQEKNNADMEIEGLNQQYYTVLEEIQLLDIQSKELNKTVKDYQIKLKQKQSVYDNVRIERNIYSKELLTSQDEINGLKLKYREMSHHITQLKKEISLKEHALVKENFYHQSIERDKELLKNENVKTQKQIDSSEGILKDQREEIDKLRKITDNAEIERYHQMNELTSMISERNMLISHVVKRNSEVKEMYNKLKLQQNLLITGELEYKRSVEAMNDWQKQLVSMVKQHESTLNKITGLDIQRKAIIQLEKKYTQETIKTAALNDELQRPINIHRWRIIQSADPIKYEKILRIQQLQKQLIDKTAQTAALMHSIENKETEYNELKIALERRVNAPEVEEQISNYQMAYKDKNKQSSAIEMELNTAMQQVRQYKKEIATYDSEILKLEKKWVKLKTQQIQTQQQPLLIQSQDGYNYNSNYSNSYNPNNSDTYITNSYTNYSAPNTASSNMANSNNNNNNNNSRSSSPLKLNLNSSSMTGGGGMLPTIANNNMNNTIGSYSMKNQYL